MITVTAPLWLWAGQNGSWRFIIVPEEWGRRTDTAGKCTPSNRAAILKVSEFSDNSKVARPAGFEPATPSLEGSCSIQLSYGRTLR